MAHVLTSEQQSFVEAIRDFCARECGTQEQRKRLTNDYTTPHSDEIYKKMAELGWLGIAIPEQYGGSGGGMVDLCLFLEESSRGMAPIAAFGTTAIVAGAYERFGTDAQKQEILGGIMTGNVEAIVMSEPEAGSDVSAVTCRADKTEGGFLLNGQKTWCSNAQITAHILVIARNDSEGPKHEGVTLLSVPAGAAGMEIRPIPTMAGPEEVNDIFFTDCFVPDDAVLGTVGAGWMQLMTGLNAERLILAAMYLGTMQRAFDQTLEYIKERKQFGRPIGSFQALRHRIADLATEIECCKLLVYDVAAGIDADPDRVFAREASMAKLKVTEVTKKVALEGMQMMGGYGYALEYDMEKFVRTGLVGTIFGGTSEIQREIISKTYGL